MSLFGGTKEVKKAKRAARQHKKRKSGGFDTPKAKKRHKKRTRRGNPSQNAGTDPRPPMRRRGGAYDKDGNRTGPA